MGYKMKGFSTHAVVSPAQFKGADSSNSSCWKGYKKVGTKKSPSGTGKTVNDCVKVDSPAQSGCASHSPGKYASPAKRTKPYTAGMTAAERKTHNNKTGGNVKAPQPGGGSRKDSYCARSAGIKKCKDPDKNGDCPNDIARRNWKC
jgi:hypothetical protein